MKLTKNAKIFTIIGVIITAIYFPLLDWLIPRSERMGLVLIAAVLYGSLWLAAGMVLGKSDTSRKYPGDLALLYHLLTSVIVTVGASLSFLFLQNIGWADAAWAIGILWGTYLIHWLAVRNDIKGHTKKELFK